jgi:CheY-like chemotaxis protein
MQPAVLIVDDVAANLLAMEVALDGLDVETVRASSGEEAVRLTAGRDFAAILMDVRMPGMDGVEAAAVIRRRSHGGDVSIVLVSALDRDLVHVERGYGAGAIDYLVKPLDEQALRAKVSVLVDMWQARQAERQQREQRIHDLEQEVSRLGVLADRPPAVPAGVDAAGGDAGGGRDRQLLSWLGHELRNPLAALFTVMQVRARRGPGLADWEQTLVRQLDRLGRLAGELSRLEREGGAPPALEHGLGGEAVTPVDRRRVLLVDDNEDALNALAELLRDAGADVATATTANQALRVASGFHPTAVVVDLGLPDMDGHQLGRRLRQLIDSPLLRLFVLSGFGSQQEVDRSRIAGFDEHFVKPADLSQLLQALGLA